MRPEGVDLNRADARVAARERSPATIKARNRMSSLAITAAPLQAGAPAGWTLAGTAR
jgi:hypothetical protein